MKKILKLLAFLLILEIVVTYTGISVATSKSELESQQSEIESSISDAEDELESVQAEKSETLTEVENLSSQISSYEDEISDLETQISELEAQILDAEKQIEEDEAEYQKQQEALNERLVTMYEAGSVSYLDVLLSSTSLIEFISNYYLVSEMTEYDTEMLAAVEAEKQKIEEEKAELEESKTALDTAKSAKEEKTEALKTAKAEKEDKVSELSEEEQEIQEKIEELKATNNELDKQIKAAQAAIEAAKKAAEADNASSSSSSTTSGRSSTASTTESSYGFIWPVDTQYPITTGWYYSSGALHGGVDFSGSGIAGSPIYAVADGYVVTSTACINESTGNYYSYGNYVLIAHYNGLYTLYAHMSSRSVSAGQTVSQGQIIGYVGSTGNSTGAHLHFEVRTGDGTYANRVYPGTYLP